jgi:hypothetical protein
MGNTAHTVEEAVFGVNVKMSKHELAVIIAPDILTGDTFSGLKKQYF